MTNLPSLDRAVREVTTAYHRAEAAGYPRSLGAFFVAHAIRTRYWQIVNEK
jgi:hypothetical protein